MQPAPFVLVVAALHLSTLVLLESFAALVPAAVAYGTAVALTRRADAREVSPPE